VLSQHGSAHSAARVLAGVLLGRGYLLKDRIHDLDHLVSTIEGGRRRVPHRSATGGRSAGSPPVRVRRSRRSRPASARSSPSWRQVAATWPSRATSASRKRAVEKHVNEIFGRLGIANDESISRRVHATLLFSGRRRRTMTVLRVAWSPLWLPGTRWRRRSCFRHRGAEPGRWINAGLAAVGVLLTWMVAIAVRTRYPQRPMATLLFMLTALLAIHPALGGSSAPICSRWPAWRAWPAS
jgi:hypothetical protein